VANTRVSSTDLSSLSRAQFQRLLRAVLHGERIDQAMERTGRRAWIRRAVPGELVEPPRPGRTYFVLVRSLGQGNFKKIAINPRISSPPPESEQDVEMMIYILERHDGSNDPEAIRKLGWEALLSAVPAAGKA
jgi:hypothetical protein